MDGCWHRCSARTRLGPGRASAFAAISAGTPLLAHQADELAVAATWLLLMLLYIGWTWSRTCVHPRNLPVLAAMIGAGQLATHVAYAFAESIGSAGAAHAHLHDAAASTSQHGGSSWTMVAVHVLAALAGAGVLTYLDRRAAAAAVTFVRRVRRFVQRLLYLRRTHESIGIPSATASRSAIDAIARTARRAGRARTRRGPPALVAPH